MKKLAINLLFSIAMVLMTLLLAIAATLICTVRLLDPAHLTPVVQAYANKALDAEVSVKRVELSFRPAFPVVQLEIDSLQIVSKAFAGLDSAERAALPAWSDTLFTLDGFRGSLNIGAIITRGEIDVHNVELLRPGLNVVLDSHGRGNFDIYHSTPDTVPDTAPVVIPPFAIDHFAFVEPREIRYFNAADSTAASIVLLREMRLDNSGEPVYTLRIDGHLDSPFTESAINMRDLAFGLGGRVHWNPAQPGMLALEKFKLHGAFVSATLDAALDYDTTLAVNSARLEIDPVPVSDMLTVLPDSVRRANRLIAPYFTTDGAISLEAHLLQPFHPALDSVPHASVNIAMADCGLRYGKAVFRKAGFEIGAELHGPDLDSARIDIRRLVLAGPATQINLSGTATNLATDPDFDMDLKADMNLKLLPPVVANLAKGFLSGRIDADVKASGSLSMFSQDKFHCLDVRGRLKGHNLYYLSNDTAKMAEIASLGIAFGSQVKMRNDTSSLERKNRRMLSAGIKIDTATVLIDGVNITLSGLALGAGVENNRQPPSDTTLVVPVGGGLRIARLNIESITDTAGVRIRDLGGHVALRRFSGMSRVPELLVNFDLGRMAAGTPSSRLVLSKAHLDASTHKLPRVVEREQAIRHLTDSIRQRHPDLPADSVYKLALEKRRHRPGQPRRRRVYSTTDDADLEVLEWDLSKGLRKFLLGWELNGTLSTRRARLFTPLFPIRNRISRLDIAFSNDSVRVRNLRYRAGRSDIAVTGLVSNIKRALTSKRSGNSLKINFALQSDTIDVNQISAAAFAGAAYAHRIANGAQAVRLGSDDEDALDQRLDAMASQTPDSVGPLLIPTNLDGRIELSANNIMYSDMAMTDLTGALLLFDGGVNLHDLTAKSDAGDLTLSALYSAPRVADMSFGFGLDLTRFNIQRFLTLVPAVDSVMPLMRDFSGIIDANIAATVKIDSTMNLVLPTLDAALKLSGDSLAFIDPETYATIGKWLRFRDRADNKIKHVSVEMIVRDNMLQIFPFSFDIDRYRLGVVGYNDLNLNFDYHISVLKSPIPFKFGVTVKGNPDKYKVRLGGAKFKEGQVAESVNVVDTARVNLLRQIENVFRRGVQRSRFSRLNINTPDVRKALEEPDPVLSASDSLVLKAERPQP